MFPGFNTLIKVVLVIPYEAFRPQLLKCLQLTNMPINLWRRNVDYLYGCWDWTLTFSKWQVKMNLLLTMLVKQNVSTKSLLSLEHDPKYTLNINASVECNRSENTPVLKMVGSDKCFYKKCCQPCIVLLSLYNYAICVGLSHQILKFVIVT